MTLRAANCRKLCTKVLPVHERDAGREERDAGKEGRDAGREGRDAGRERRDAGKEGLAGPSVLSTLRLFPTCSSKTDSTLGTIVFPGHCSRDLGILLYHYELTLTLRKKVGPRTYQYFHVAALPVCHYLPSLYV